MKNTTELRKEMEKLFEKVKNNEIDTTVTKRLVSISNVMLRSASLELEQNKLLKEKAIVEFLKTPKND